MVVRLIGKFLSLLLFKAGLWAPLLFAAVYGSLVRFAGIPFSVTGMGVGAVVAWVLGVTAAVVVYRRRRIIDDDCARTTMRRVKRREPAVKVRYGANVPDDLRADDAGNSLKENYAEQNYYISDAERNSFSRKYNLSPYDAPSQPYGNAPDGYGAQSNYGKAPDGYGAQSNYGKAPDGYGAQSSYGDGPSDGVSPATAAYANSKPDAEEIFRTERERLWARLESGRRQPEAQSEEAERPYAYASRTDPNLYIYEYSDRLEYYRRMGDEMILTSTEYKTEGKNSALR